MARFRLELVLSDGSISIDAEIANLKACELLMEAFTAIAQNCGSSKQVTEMLMCGFVTSQVNKEVAKMVGLDGDGVDMGQNGAGEGQ